MLYQEYKRIIEQSMSQLQGLKNSVTQTAGRQKQESQRL